MYNLFLDDIRLPNCLGNSKTWEVVRNYKGFIDKITKDGLPDFISFDHDLSAMHYPQTNADYDSPIDYSSKRYYLEKTGYHCAQFLIEYCEKHHLDIPLYQVHSMNPVGRQNIVSLIESYKRSKQ